MSPVVLLGLAVSLLPQHYFIPGTERFAADNATEKINTQAVLTVHDAGSNGEATEHIQEKLISYALSLLGSPYVYAGLSPDGFDCSGFTTYVFAAHDISIPHSSAMQAEQGRSVARQEARPGDLVIFTGTNPEVRKPGHVGIIISSPGDTIEFVHSSSNGGVKISKVEGTRYDTRFLDIRRVL